jgi:hypothetical protein
MLLFLCIFNCSSFQLPTLALKKRFMRARNKLFSGGAESCEIDLWVVGAGTLGGLVCQRWKEKFPTTRVVAETSSSVRHQTFLDQNLSPRIRSERKASDYSSVKNVVISIPPSSSTDYVSEIQDAVRLWKGIEGGGHLVFTSSIGVFSESSGKKVTESSSVDLISPRSKL